MPIAQAGEKDVHDLKRGGPDKPVRRSGHPDGASRLPPSPFTPVSRPLQTASSMAWSGRRTARCAPTTLAQQRRHNFLPLPAKPPFRAEQESSSCAVQPLWGAPAFVSGRSIAIEAAMVRARKRKTET